MEKLRKINFLNCLNAFDANYDSSEEGGITHTKQIVTSNNKYKDKPVDMGTWVFPYLMETLITITGGQYGLI